MNLFASPASLGYAIGFGLTLLMLIYILRMPFKRRFHWIFTTWVVFMALLFIAAMWAQFAEDSETFFTRIWWGNFFGFPVQMILIYHFTLSFVYPNLSRKQTIILIGTYGYVVFWWGSLILDPSLVIGTPRSTSTGWIGGPGLLTPYTHPYGIGLIYIATNILIFTTLIKNYHSRESPIIRQQILYLSLGILLLTIAFHSFTLARYLGGINTVPYLAPSAIGLMLLGLRKHAFFVITPEPEIPQLPISQSIQRLPMGYTYLVNDPITKQSFEVFSNQVMNNSLGLCVTRYSPEKIRETYQLKRTPILWLSEEYSSNSIDPTDLRGILTTIKAFLKRAEQPVVMLHGLEYLISLNSFNSVLRLVVRLSDLTAQRKGVLIIPISPNILTERQVNLLKAESPYLRWLEYPTSIKEPVSLSLEDKRETHVQSFIKQQESIKESNTNNLQKLQFSKAEEAKTYRFLAQEFVRDYTIKRISIESSGWRSTSEIAKGARISLSRLYGSSGQPSIILAELLTRGLVETRKYPGRRGRGGTITKMRVNFSNPYVKADIDRLALQPNNTSYQ